jgi:hypothetical protein
MKELALEMIIGVYNLNGISNSKVRPDPQRALRKNRALGGFFTRS